MSGPRRSQSSGGREVGELSAFRGLLAVVAFQTLSFAPLAIGNALLGSPLSTSGVYLGSAAVAVVAGVSIASGQHLVDRVLNVWIVFLFAMVGWYFAVAAVLELAGVDRAGILILQAPAYVLAFATAVLVAER